MELPVHIPTTCTTNYEILQCALCKMAVHLVRDIDRSAGGSSSTRHRLDLIRNLVMPGVHCASPLSESGSQRNGRERYAAPAAVHARELQLCRISRQWNTAKLIKKQLMQKSCMARKKPIEFR
jgi:hypothetical protein